MNVHADPNGATSIAVVAPNGLPNGRSSCTRRDDILVDHSEIQQFCSGTLLAPIRYNEHVPREKAMNIATTGIKLTYDDFLRFPDDGKRHELIDGEHYVTPSPNLPHQSIAGTLYGLLWTYLRKEPRGRVFFAPLDVVLSHFDIVEPDLLYVSNTRAADVLTELHVKGVPDLVVEIKSPSTGTRDTGLKRRLYERFGVSEYWLVDPKTSAITVYRGGDTGFDAPIKLHGATGDTLTSPLFPDLALSLSEVFETK